MLVEGSKLARILLQNFTRGIRGVQREWPEGESTSNQL